jgi:hypothetical protein
MSTLEATAARERCIGIPRPRQQGGPQGRLCRRKQQQQAQEGYSRRRQGAAIAAARREAAEAKAKTKLLEAKMKTMEATLSRVAAMLPSLERLQHRESAAAAKIQAVLQGYATRKTVRERLAVHQKLFHTFQRAQAAVKLQSVIQQLRQQQPYDWERRVCTDISRVYAPTFTFFEETRFLEVTTAQHRVAAHIEHNYATHWPRRDPKDLAKLRSILECSPRIVLQSSIK